VLVLNIVVEHRLSLRNLEAEMGLDRYANVLSAEWRFVRETGLGGGPLIHRLRLLKRTLIHTMNLRNKGLCRQDITSRVGVKQYSPIGHTLAETCFAVSFSRVDRNSTLS
jgi:hypothetical protein